MLKGTFYMHNHSSLHLLANDYLLKTSRTFAIPIAQLPDSLWDAVASSYLCMRAIDEIEDHATLSQTNKIILLREISKLITKSNLNTLEDDINTVLLPYSKELPEVTMLLPQWLKLVPNTIQYRLHDAISRMSNGMAEWVSKSWNITSKADLDEYTFYVAGIVGEMLSSIWVWFSNIETNPTLAVAFGRGLQAVNIVRNREEDLKRGVNFYPVGWDDKDMLAYARQNLLSAELYTETLPHGPIYNFCKIPLVLAHATLDVISMGADKLTRQHVAKIIQPYIHVAQQ